MRNKIRCKIIVCDNVQTEMTPLGPKNSIINVLPIIETNFIPTHYTFTVSCQLSGNFNVQPPIHISIKLCEPENKREIECGRVVFSEIMSQAPTTVDNMVLNFEIRNIPLYYAGDYTIQLFFDDDIIHEEVIEVRKREKNDNL